MTSKQEKELLKKYIDKIDFILEHGNVNQNETEDEQADRIEKAKKDYKYCFETYFPHYATDETADFQVKGANKAKKNKRLKAVMEWARGLGKSVHWDIGIPFWLWLNGEMKFNVTISANHDAAKILISDIQAEFEANPLIKHDFGLMLQYGSWAEGDFVLKDGTRFVARGRGQKLRGLRKGANRPDYVVIDDTDDDELSENPARVKKVINWTLKAVLGLGDKGNFRVIIVNNRISNNSILAHFADHPKWYHLRVDALDKDGNPSWYQKYTIEYYNELEETTSYHSFQTEYMNNPVIEGDVFKEEDILWIPIDFRHIKGMTRVIGYWDPAYTGNPRSDFNSIVLLGFKGRYIYVLDTYTKQVTPDKAVSMIYEFEKEYKSHGIAVEFYVEKQLINKIVEDAIDEVAEQNGYYVSIIRDERKKGNKFSRIVSIAFYFQKQFIAFNKRKKQNFEAAKSQLLGIKVGYKSKDDFPDALEGGIIKGVNSKQFSKSMPRVGKNKKAKAAW